ADRAADGGERDGDYRGEAVPIDRIPGDGDERVGHDAASAERLAEPVPDFIGHAIHVLLQHVSDAADRLPVDRDREERLRRYPPRIADEGPTGAGRIGMRKPIPQVDPDVPV